MQQTMHDHGSPNPVERHRRFTALGGEVLIQATGDGSGSRIRRAETKIRNLQRRLTRFEPDSELCRLNRNPRRSVPASPIMLRFAGLVADAGELSGGLVDTTCIDAVERAGYTESISRGESDGGAIGPGPGIDGRDAQPGGADPGSRWRSVSVDQKAGTVLRPPGVRLDSGGLGKGLAADIGAEELLELDSYAVSCVGDIRFGGKARMVREVLVAAPIEDERPIATIRLAQGAVATSGITRRSWIDAEGRIAHHLIDPLTGRPADTGVIQVTAVAPTGVEAEVRAKAGLLAGPHEAERWLVHGGVAVLDDGRVIATGDCVELEEDRE
jgi:thiamine biosynthesis lipoprotein